MNFVCGNEDSKKKKHVIRDAVDYLKEITGEEEFTLVKKKEIEGVGNAQCSDWGGGNNCTLTGVYNIMQFYRSRGCKNIPEDNAVLYGNIKEQAKNLGYNRTDGLPVTKNNNLVKNVWSKAFGYSTGRGDSNYVWTKEHLLSQIDNDRPFLFSLASGVYFNHTITICGYVIYKSELTGKEYTFLITADAWSNNRRYVAFKNTGEKFVSCATFIVPPTEA